MLKERLILTSKSIEPFLFLSTLLIMSASSSLIYICDCFAIATKFKIPWGMNVVPGHDLGQLLNADLSIVVDVKKSKRLLKSTSWKHLSTLKPWEGSGLCPGPPLTWPWLTLSENKSVLCWPFTVSVHCPSPFVLSVTVTADFEVKPQLHACHFVCSAPFHWKHSEALL